MKYYINYYSKVRNRIGMTEEELNKEFRNNIGRIVTKEISNKADLKRLTNTMVSKMEHIYQRACIMRTNHPISVACTAFIGDDLNLFPGYDYHHEYAGMYEKFNIPKRRGGYREICAPIEPLKDIQRELLDFLTKYCKVLPHNAAHGFTRKRNCKTALETHMKHKGRWFLKLDIKDFFPNTTYTHVVKALRRTYPICLFPEHLLFEIANLCTMNETVPQGAPTSPLITNLVMLTADILISDYCKMAGLTYTRYADDILISNTVHFDWEQVQKDVSAFLEQETGHVIKEEKTRYGNFNGRNWNLGLMYNNKFEITVGHQKKKLVKNMVHNYLTKDEYHNLENYHKILGIVSYCKFIEPEYFEKYFNILQENRI